MSREVEVQNIKMTATVPEDLQISLGEITSGSDSVNLTSSTGILTIESDAVKAPTDCDDDPFDWSNSADISAYYALGKLIPAGSTNGENVFFTPDASGVGKTLKSTAQSYQAADDKTALADSTVLSSTSTTYLNATAHTFSSTEKTGFSNGAITGTGWAARSEQNTTGYLTASAFNATIAFQENKYKKGVDAEACRASSDPEGILSYVADDDETVCGYARQTFSVIFLECYNDDGYYVDIPIWLRTSSTATPSVYVTGYITKGTNTTTTGDGDTDNLYKAVRVAILDANGAAAGGAIDLSDQTSATPAAFPTTQVATASSLIDSGIAQGNYTSLTNVSALNSTGAMGTERYGNVTVNKGATQIGTLTAKAADSTTQYAAGTKFIIRVWLEGDDENCWNANAGQDWSIALKFMTSPLEAAQQGNGGNGGEGGNGG